MDKWPDPTYEIAKFVIASEVMRLAGGSRANALFAVEQVVTTSWHAGLITADSMGTIVEQAIALVTVA